MGYLVLFLFMAIIVAMIASSKKRNGPTWFLYGLLLWPIALVHSLLLKPLPESTQQDENPTGPRRCPNPECKKIVHGTQENCPYCQTPMDGATAPCLKCGHVQFINLTTCEKCQYDKTVDPEHLYSDERECPECAELIKKKAKKCKHCGAVVEPFEA